MIRQQLFNKKLLKIATAIFTLTIVSACSNNSPNITKQDRLVNVATISQNSVIPIGQSVLVHNDILEKIDEKSFILDKDSVFNGETVLVINTSQTPLKLPNHENNNVEVLVKGKVDKLDLATVEQKYGLKLDSNLYDKYQNQPVIMATSVTLSPDPEDVTAKPENYYGKYIAVKGEAEDIKSYGVFELDEQKAFGGDDLVVVSLQPQIKLKEEQMVIVYGTVRQFSLAELKEEYNLDWDLSAEKEIESEYFQKPVFIAQEIEILD